MGTARNRKANPCPLPALSSTHAPTHGLRFALCLDLGAPRAVRDHREPRARPQRLWWWLGGAAADEHLDERFNEALDFVDEPVYRSVSTDLSWQPANDELYFDSDEPVYRSFGGFGSSTGVEDVDEGLPGSHEAWMRSMPPLVQRQSACSHL